MENLEQMNLVELNEKHLHEVNGGLVELGGLLDSLLGEDGLLSNLLGSFNEIIDGVLGNLPA